MSDPAAPEAEAPQSAKPTPEDGFRGEGDSAVSGSETTAGDGEGGSASGAEPGTLDDHPDPKLSTDGGD